MFPKLQYLWAILLIFSSVVCLLFHLNFAGTIAKHKCQNCITFTNLTYSARPKIHLMFSFNRHAVNFIYKINSCNGFFLHHTVIFPRFWVCNILCNFESKEKYQCYLFMQDFITKYIKRKKKKDH